MKNPREQIKGRLDLPEERSGTQKVRETAKPWDRQQGRGRESCDRDWKHVKPESQKHFIKDSPKSSHL
jgi:hypothetical protein